jgi:predicted PurR-regulated permease PerM
LAKTRTLRSDILFAFALALACYLAWLVRDALVLLYVSALFAVVLTPLVSAIANIRVYRWKPFRRIAVPLLLVLVVAAFIAFGFLALPPVIRDMNQFAQELPDKLPALLETFRQTPFLEKLDTASLIRRLQGSASGAATYLLVSFSNWAGRLADIAVCAVLTIYFILEGDQAYRWFLSFFPLEGRTRLDTALQRARLRMGKWLLGQGSLMLILGVTSTVVFSALGLRYAYALGVLTGLLNIIPVLGAAFCIGLCLVVAAIDSWGRVAGVAIFYFIYLQVENSILIPRIMRSSVNLPGLAILSALLLGSALEGVVGAMVSVPSAVLVSVLIDEYLIQKDDPDLTRGK